MRSGCAGDDNDMLLDLESNDEAGLLSAIEDRSTGDRGGDWTLDGHAAGLDK
jgi:hypothetical protein